MTWTTLQWLIPFIVGLLTGVAIHFDVNRRIRAERRTLEDQWWKARER